jgi:threonine/homoserine efflux transporter RhtA
VSRPGLGIALAAIGGVIFGASATLGGFAVESVDPLRLAAARVGIAGLCLAPFAVLHRRAIARAPWSVAGIGLIQIAVNTLLYVAISRVGVGPGVGLEFLAPILVVAWDRVTGTARPRLITWAAVVAAVVGVGLLVEAGDLTELDPVGVLAGLGAAVGLASYLRLAEHVGATTGGFPLAAGAITFGGVVGLAISRPWGLVGTVDPAVAWSVLLLGTVAMALPLSIEMTSLSMTPARIIGVVITVEPVAAALTARWYLDQTLSTSQVAGLVMIVAAVAAVSWTTARADVPAPSPG